VLAKKLFKEKDKLTIQKEGEPEPTNINVQKIETLMETTGPNELFANEEVAKQYMPEHEGAEVTAPTTTSVPMVRRLQREWRPTKRIMESIQQEDLDLNMCAAMYTNHDLIDIDIQDPFTIMAGIEKDTMYWHEAMKQHDAPKFWDVAMDEVTTHHKNKHWEVVPIEELPPETSILDYVWSMKRKRRLLTNEVYKHTAR
jgi:hypothetical protein